MRAVIICGENTRVDGVKVVLTLAEVEALRNAVGWLSESLDGPRAPLEELRGLLENVLGDL